MPEIAAENDAPINRGEIIVAMIEQLPNGLRQEAYADLLHPETSSELLDALAFG